MILTATRDFVFKKSSELSALEKGQFRALFGRVFGKEMSSEWFERKYTCTPLGYSHHGLMVIEGRVVGAYNLVPYRYKCFGADVLFGLSVDAMIDEAHRTGPFNMVKMARLVYEGAVQDGVAFAFGFPNDQAYVFTKKILKWQDLGELEFYALPIDIGAVCRSLRWARPFSRLCAAALVKLPRWRRSVVADFAIEKVADETFCHHRYDEQHVVVGLSQGGSCVYRLYDEADGVKTLYLLDVSPLTAAHLAEAVQAVYPVAAAHAHLILYVGRLPFRPYGLLRIPPARCPRRIRMCAKLLDPQCDNNRVFDIDNWNINISNLDVR